MASAIQTEIAAREADGHWRIRAGVIMPDRLHLLAALTGSLALGRVVARLKAKTRAMLASADRVRWQGNYYDRRLRPDDSVEDILRYLFLNPYRAGLLPATGRCPLFWLHPDEAAWFKPLLDDERPFPDWLR